MPITSIDDIVGNYQTNTYGLEDNLTNIVVAPPKTPGANLTEIIMFFAGGERAVAEANVVVSDGVGRVGSVTGFTAVISAEDHIDITVDMSFTESNGIWSLTGTAQEIVRGLPGPQIEILGVNTNTEVNQQTLDDFKEIFPDDAAIQNADLGHILHYAATANIDGAGATLDPVRGLRPDRRRATISDCILNCAAVIIDAVLIVAMAAPLAKIVFGSGNAVTKVALLVERAGATKIVPLIEEIKAASGGYETAQKVWELIKALNGFGIIKKIVGAITSVLSWWDWLLFGLMILGTIVAALATAGVALLARLALLVVSVASFVTDLVKAVDTCSDIQQQPQP